MSNVLVDRLTAIFGLPGHVEDPAAYAKEIGEVLSGFSEEVLSRAASNLIRNGGKFWPTPKAIVDACNEAQEGLVTAARMSTLPAPRKKWPWELDAERAAAWSREFMAQSWWQHADGEGWGRSLRLWAQSYARERYRRGKEPDRLARPTSEEIEYWKHYCRQPMQQATDELTDSEFIDRAADGSLELHGPLAGHLRRMASLMKARRQESEEAEW